jgi:hypothetical protein
MLSEITQDFKDCKPLLHICNKLGIQAGFVIIVILFIGFFFTTIGICP